MTASFDLEKQVNASTDFRVFGVDEVGRGPLAGPVVAAAVHIPPALWETPEVGGFEDSKKVSSRRRAVFAEWIKKNCLWAITEVSSTEIDQLNILQASLAAMSRALMKVPASYALIDGNKVPNTSVPCQAIVKGDSKSRSIAAASILAKVYRDELMISLDVEFPAYGWAQNMGYGTAQHRLALVNFGATPYHRRSFRGV